MTPVSAFATILVPLDGSPLGEHAIPYAAALARAAGGRLVLVHAARDAAERRHTEEAMANLAERLWKGGVQVETHVRYGSPAAVIAQAAAAWEAELVAMSTHGRSGPGRWVYGSVADAVLRQSTVPVLLVPAMCDHRWQPFPAESGARRPRLVVPLDGSAAAERALPPACALAPLLGAEVHLARVASPPPTALDEQREAMLWGYTLATGPLPAVTASIAFPRRAPVRPDGRFHRDAQDIHELSDAGDYLDAVSAGLSKPSLPVRTHVLAGSPAAELLALAKREDADLLVMATHGRSGLARLALGSVATALIHRAPAPLLLIGPACQPSG